MKKIISLVLVAVLALTAIGGTLAYFTDKDENVNTFTMGDVSIVLDEAPVQYNQQTHEWEADEDAARVHQNAYGQVYPGAVLPKDPTVHNDGKNDAYIRVTIEVSNWLNACADLYDDVTPMSAESLTKLVGTLGADWSVVTVEVGDNSDVMAGVVDAKYVLQYNKVLTPDTDTTPIFTTLTIPAEIESGKDYKLENMKIVAEAIQSDTFETWADAFAAYDAQ